MCNFANLCPGCGVCRNVCPFLAEYGTPDRILKDRPEVSFFCTSCRRCDGVCTKALSPSAAFFEVKHRLVRQNAIPPPVVKALDSARRFAKTGHGFPFSFYEPADIVFWPGCGLAAHRPGLVHRVRNILSRQLKKQVGLALDCCYDPVYGLGDMGTALAALNRIGERLRKRSVRQVITGCLNCHKLLSEHLEGIHVVFILEMLPSEVFSKQQRESVYLHHPCPSSRWEAIQDKAKEAIASLGADFTERGADLKSVPPGPTVSESSAALCCGNGGGLSALDPNLADRFLDRITKEAADRTMVTYCTGCQDRFLKRGRAAVHLLEYLPGVKPRGKIPTPLLQWANRFYLTLAAGFFWGPLWGVIFSITGATVGSCLPFFLARPLFQEAVRAKVPPERWEWLQDKVNRHGWKAVAFTRLVPLFPFNLLNYLFGLTPIPFHHYFWSTFVFMLPACIAFVAFGSSLGELVMRGNVKGVVIGLGVAVCAFLLTVTLRRLYRKIGI